MITTWIYTATSWSGLIIQLIVNAELHYYVKSGLPFKVLDIKFPHQGTAFGLQTMQFHVHLQIS